MSQLAKPVPNRIEREKKEEEEREEGEESHGQWSDLYLFLTLQPPFYLLCLLSSNFNASYVHPKPSQVHYVIYKSMI